MDEKFVQGVVGGVLNRHHDRTLDQKRIDVLSVEIAAVLEEVGQHFKKAQYKKSKPSNETDEQAYLEFWTCDICDEHTHKVDYDYLGSGTNHLACELKQELEEQSNELGDE
tara:strand:- start:464 stop:796 length:333 start_codon:yes stop_codon:yes gene_type:complete